MKTTVKKNIFYIAMFLLTSAMQSSAATNDFPEAFRELLRDYIELDQGCPGMVVGLVDESGPKVISFGKMDGPDTADVNGDTIFEIGSVTKTFTALLLQDMVERGEMQLDDPVSKYLPKSVKMPTRSGKEITLVQLATHTSGLPRDPENLTPRRWANYYETYTLDQLYAFLSGYTLARDPGAEYEYSNLGMGLLGHVVALRAGTNFESVVLERICKPLKMDSTRVVLTPELRGREAIGHDHFGHPTGEMINPTLTGCGGLRSTANDMLKYLSANLGLTASRLTPMMEKTHETRLKNQTDDGADSQGMAWVSAGGGETVWHSGGTWGFGAIAVLQKKKHRGIVVLFNSSRCPGLYPLVGLLLNSDWQTEKRTAVAIIDHHIYDSYTGEYRLNSNCTMGIRREGDRLLAQVTGQISFELLPESAKDFYMRLSGRSVSFVRNTEGKVTDLNSDVNGTNATFVRISDQPPPHIFALKPPVFVKVDEKALNAFEGAYEFPSRRIVTIRRDGDHLLLFPEHSAAVELYPESETKMSCGSIPVEVNLLKGDNGAIVGLIVSSPAPDLTGKAVKIDHQAYDTYSGRYEPLGQFAMGAQTILASAGSHGRAAILVGFSLLLLFLFIPVANFRKRFLIVGLVLCMAGLVFTFAVMTRSKPPAILVRRLGNRLVAERKGRPNVELLPVSVARFSLGFGGAPLTFIQDAGGNVTGLISWEKGVRYTAERVFDSSPDNLN